MLRIATVSSCALAAALNLSCADSSTDSTTTTDAAPSDAPAGGQWVVTVKSGAVAAKRSDGKFWDDAGLVCTRGDGSENVCHPDPKVCMTIGGKRECTPVQSDTFAPTWNYAFAAAAGDALTAGVLVEYVDQDGDTEESICTVSAAKPALDATTPWSISCSDGKSTISASLAPR